jgi:hypothetical protein
MSGACRPRSNGGEAPQGTGKPGPFFTTVIRRASEFKGYVLEYSVRRDTPMIYTAESVGWETQEEIFKMGYEGFFSCKECEVWVLNGIADRFVDWQNVHDTSELVLGRRQDASQSASSAPAIVPSIISSRAVATASSLAPRGPKIKQEFKKNRWFTPGRNEFILPLRN